MSNQRVEIQHNEPEQIRAWLREGLTMLHEHDLTPLEHPDVLCKLIDLLAAKTIQEVRFVPPDLIPASAGSLAGGRRGH